MEEEQVIQLHFSRGNIFVWNSRDVRLLRDTHHIVGALTGSLPRAPRQNNQLGLPLKLMPEEAFALITYGVAKLMRLNLPYHSQHDVTTFQEARKESFEKQKSIYLEQTQVKKNIYRNSKHSQLSKKKKRKQKQMKKYEKEKLETSQAAETVPENPDGRVGGAKTCNWEEGARDDSKLVKDMNVAHRDWFPIVEKSSSKDATDQCILGDSSQAREGLHEMDIDDNSKQGSDRKGLSTNPNQSTSHLITYSGDEDAPTGAGDKLEPERPLSLNNVKELPASLETTSLQQLPNVNEETNMDTSQGSSSLTSNCSHLGMKDGVPATLPYMSASTSSTSNTNISPIDLNLIDSRHGKETAEATTCFNNNINVTTYSSTNEQTMPNICTGNCPPNQDKVSKVTDSRPGETNTVIEKETKRLKLKQTDGESHVMEPTLEGINAATEGIKAATDSINAATEGINTATEGIKATVEGINTTTEEIKITTEEIKATTEEIKTTTEKINATTEEIKATTEEIKATTEEIKTTTKEINATTEEIKTTTEEIKDQMADGMVNPPKQLIKPEENTQVCEEADQSASPMDLPRTQAGSTVTDNGCLIQLFTETVNPDMTEVNDWSFPSTDQERIRAAVFLHFWEQGYYLTSGMKFGGDFLIYKGDPLLYHSTFIAVCLPYQKSMSTQMIISYGRLGPIVKKTVLLCSLDDQGNVRSVSLQWSGI